MACRISPYLDTNSNPTETSNTLVSGSTRDNQGCCEHDTSQYVPLAEHIGLKIELNTLKYQMDYPDISFVNDRANIDQKDTTEKQTLEENELIISLQNEKMNLEMEIRSLKKTIEELRDNLAKTTEDRIVFLQMDKEKLEMENKVLKNNIEELINNSTKTTDDRIVFLQMDKMNLQLENTDLKNSIELINNNNTNTDLERDLELSREREKLLNTTVASKDQQIRELTTKIQTGPDDTTRGEIIKVILQEKASLHVSIEQLQQRLSNYRELEDRYSEVTLKLNEGEIYIRELRGTISKLQNELNTLETDSKIYKKLLFESKPTDNNTQMVQDLMHENETVQKRYTQKSEDARKFEAEAREANLLLTRLKNRVPIDMDYSYLSSKSQQPD